MSRDETVVFRPRNARIVPYAAAAALLAAHVIVAILLPAGGPRGWSLAPRISVVVFGAAVAWFLHRLADVRLVADSDGVEVVNILVRRRFDWAQVVNARLTRDDAWLTLDISDGSTIAAMGIQRSEGDRALVQVQQFRRLLADHTPPEQPADLR